MAYPTVIISKYCVFPYPISEPTPENPKPQLFVVANTEKDRLMGIIEQQQRLVTDQRQQPVPAPSPVDQPPSVMTSIRRILASLADRIDG
jgi:hypothetical protein